MLDLLAQVGPTQEVNFWSLEPYSSGLTIRVIVGLIVGLLILFGLPAIGTGTQGAPTIA